MVEPWGNFDTSELVKAAADYTINMCAETEWRVHSYTKIANWTKQCGNILTETPIECKGVWKHGDFRPISRFISEMIQQTTIVTMKCKNEAIPRLSSDSIINDLEQMLTQI